MSAAILSGRHSTAIRAEAGAGESGQQGESLKAAASPRRKERQTTLPARSELELRDALATINAAVRDVRVSGRQRERAQEYIDHWQGVAA